MTAMIRADRAHAEVHRLLGAAAHITVMAHPATRAQLTTRATLARRRRRGLRRRRLLEEIRSASQFLGRAAVTAVAGAASLWSTVEILLPGFLQAAAPLLT